MKDSRIGESLWYEWAGNYFDDMNDGESLAYYTIDHIDMDNDVVKRALASALQRDGVAVSLGEGYKIVESSAVTYGHAGYVDGDYELSVCDYDGITKDGDTTDDVLEVTFAVFRWRT